jgi:hypothetical protein
MDTIYLIGIVVIGMVILFYYHYKTGGVNKNQIIAEIPTEIKPEMPTKNNWLYPTDEFGKMENGVVSESITYIYELNENNRNDFVILSEKKLVKRKKYRR